MTIIYSTLLLCGKTRNTKILPEDFQYIKKYHFPQLSENYFDDYHSHFSDNSGNSLQYFLEQVPQIQTMNLKFQYEY